MAQGPGEHRRVTAAIREQLINSASIPTVVTSADALIEAIRALGAHRVALVTPYLKPLAQKVVDYIETVLPCAGRLLQKDRREVE